jgi:hypothetical protein
LILGIVYVAVGLLGFAVTGGVGFAATEGKTLLGIFELNPLHNLVHLAIGAALLLGYAAGRKAAGGIALAIGVVYLVVGVLGFFVENSSANILAVNLADHLLHLGSGAVLVAAGLNASRSSA